MSYVAMVRIGGALAALLGVVVLARCSSGGGGGQPPDLFEGLDASPGMGPSLICQGSEGCRFGQVCCFSVSSDGAASSACEAPPCPSASSGMQLCRISPECVQPGAICEPEDTAVGFLTYCASSTDSGADADTDGGGGGPNSGNAPCDGGCGDGAVCAFAVDAGCSAAGVCVPLVGPGSACKVPTWCGCDGGTFAGLCGLSLDYSPAPTLGGFYAACSMSDAGGVDSATDAPDGGD